MPPLMKGKKAPKKKGMKQMGFSQTQTQKKKKRQTIIIFKMKMKKGLLPLFM
jgi:hypothetical protein